MDKKIPSQVTIAIAIAIAILAVSTSSIFIRLAQKETPSLVIAALRLTFATILLAPYALVRNRKEIRSLTKTDLFLCILSGFFLALHFSSWITSLEYTSITSSVVLVSTGPLWVAILSPFLLKEPLSKNTIRGLILALLGGLIIAAGSYCKWDGIIVCANNASSLKTASILGGFLALLGAISVSGYLIIGRKLRTRISLVTYAFIVYGFSAVILLIITIFSGKSFFGYSITNYFWIFLLALIPQIIGHSTYNWALKFLPATLVAVGTLGEPIGSTILAFFILKETPGLFELFGAFFILLGISISLLISEKST